MFKIISKNLTFLKLIWLHNWKYHTTKVRLWTLLKFEL